LRGGAAGSALRRETLEIEPPGAHAQMPVGRHRPQLARAVPIELDTVLIVVAQIERLADPVVAGAVEGNAGRDEPAQRVAQRGPRRIEDGKVVEAGGAGRRRRAAEALPGVEADVVMISAGRNERGLAPAPLHQLEAEDAAIERQRALEVRHLEVHVTDAGTVGYRP